MQLRATAITADSMSTSVGPFTLQPGRLIEIFVSSVAFGATVRATGFGVTWVPVSYNQNNGYRSVRLRGVVAGESPVEGTLVVDQVDGTDTQLEWWHCFVRVIEHDADIVATNNGADAYIQAARSHEHDQFGAYPNELAPLQANSTVSGFAFAAMVSYVSASAGVTLIPGTDTPGNVFFDIAMPCFYAETASGSITLSGAGGEPAFDIAELARVVEPVHHDLGASSTEIGIETGNAGVVTLPRAKLAHPLNVKQLHSGHSLVDPGFYPGFPGIWRALLMGLGVPYEHMAKSTLPGSQISWRWNNDHIVDPSARNDIADWELLVIAESVPFVAPVLETSAAYLSLYVNNSWTNGNNGNGAATLLFTTWTHWDNAEGNGEFRSTLDAYGEVWEQIQDYANANRPAGCPHVYAVPGHKMMARFFDDIALGNFPGVTNISQLFRDSIHINDLGSYAWCMLHYAAIFHRSPVGLPRDLWGDQLGWGDSTDTPSPPNIPTEAQALYVQQVVWEEVNAYPRAGVTGEADTHDFGAAGAEIGIETGDAAFSVHVYHELGAAGSEIGIETGNAVFAVFVPPQAWQNNYAIQRAKIFLHQIHAGEDVTLDIWCKDASGNPEDITGHEIRFRAFDTHQRREIVKTVGSGIEIAPQDGPFKGLARVTITGSDTSSWAEETRLRVVVTKIVDGKTSTPVVDRWTILPAL